MWKRPNVYSLFIPQHNNPNPPAPLAYRWLGGCGQRFKCDRWSLDSGCRRCSLPNFPQRSCDEPQLQYHCSAWMLQWHHRAVNTNPDRFYLVFFLVHSHYFCQVFLLLQLKRDTSLHKYIYIKYASIFRCRGERW